MHPGLSSLKNAIYKTLCLEKLSVSSTFILISSVFIRFMAMGCIGLAIYFLYGESIVDDEELPALNTITLHSMPLGSFIKRLIYSSCMLFPLEFLLGILGIFANLQKKKSILFVYICLCMTVIVIYVVLIILWSILYDGVNGRVENSFQIFYDRYQAGKLMAEYETNWHSYYTNFTCCGSTDNQSCRNVTGENPGCYDKLASKMRIYMQTILCILCIFTVCQVVTIIASDYNLIKLQLKEQKKHISFQKKNILCLKEYGLLPTFWGFLRLIWKRSPVRLLSVVNKSVNLLCGTTLVIVSIYFVDSDLVSNWDLIKYFRKIKIYSYNFHDLMAGFGGGFLAIGCLSIGNSILGFIGSYKQTTLLHTLSFFFSCFLIVVKCIDFVYWAVVYDQIMSYIGSQLNYVVKTNPVYPDISVFVNRLMVNFQCCEFDQTNSNLESFCYSDMDDTIINFSINYFNSPVFYNSITFGVYGVYGGLKKCGYAIEERLRLPSGFFFTCLVIGIVSDILAMILISKEHKERQREKQIQDGVQEKTTGMHLIPWLINIYQKNKPRSIYQLIYIIVTAFMMMLELSFIVLTSIFAISSHVERDYIKGFADMYMFLAISGIALASCCMIGRIIGLVGVHYQLRKTIFVGTSVMVVTTLLSLAYIIIASAIRHEEYPCYYQAGSIIQDCSRQLEWTAGVAIGMFVIEFVMQIIALLIHDRSYQYFLVDMATDEDKIKPGLLKTFYSYLFVDRPIFKHGPKLQLPIVVYSISCAAVLLLEITFVVLVCFYGVSWYVDKSWVDSGLYNIYEATINLGVLFDFLSIGSLVLIPIICMNRFFGIAAILKSQKIFLYLNSVIMFVTFLLTVISIVLTSFLLGFLYKCEIKINFGQTESCPQHRTTIVGTALAAFIIEFIMQVLSFVVNHKSYGYFVSDVGEPPEQTARRGMFTYLYDHVFKRRKPFRDAAKFTVVVAVYVISSLVMLMIEVTFIILVSIYGLSWLLDRSWITDGLNAVTEGSLNIKLTYDFLAIGLLVLIPIIVLNRFLGIGTVFKRWKTILHLNFVVLFFTTVLTVIFLVLSSIVLGVLYRCKYNGKDCPPRMNTIVGVPIAMLILELLMQIYSFFVIDRSYQYCQSGSEEEDEKLTKSDIQKGMVISLYDKIFLRRKPFRDAAKFTVAVVVYVISTLVMLMIEVSFVVLVAIYGLSSIMDRRWITDGLWNVSEAGLNIKRTFDFLAIGLLVLMPIIVLNRFMGIGAIFKRWKKVFYLNCTVLLLTTLLILIFLLLSSIVLGVKYRCRYFDYSTNSYKNCPPHMSVIVGGAIAMLILELFMQIFSFFVIDRSYQYCPSGSNEDGESLTETNKQKPMFPTMYEWIFRRREPFIDSQKLEVFIGIHVIAAIMLFMIEVCFIVLVSIYGLSWFMDRYWITLGLHTLYISSMNLGVLFDFLTICCLVLIPVICMNRFLGIYAVSTKRTYILYINSAIMLITVLVNIICLILASILKYAEYRCRYKSPTTGIYVTCRPMNVTVGVGIAMLAVELVMQITSFVVNDRSYKHFKEQTEDESNHDRLSMYIIRKYILKSKLLTEFSQLTIVTMLICIGSTIWMVVEISFWVGNIIAIGSPRFISGTLMGILYSKSIDNINLGHLADGLGYTAMGFVPVIVFVRFAGVYVMLERKSILLITPAIMSVLFCLGCGTLFGLSSYHIQYVYSCFGSSVSDCDGTMMDILTSVAAVYLAFFLIEFTIQILQSFLFFYAIKVSVNELHLFQTPEKSKRILRYIHIGIRIFEMVIAFMMMLSITFWLLDVYIHSDTASFSSKSFFNSDLLRLAKELVIYSLVTITIVIVNNIVSIVVIINGSFRILKVNTVIVGFCILSEVVSLGFQAVLDARLNDQAIGFYMSFTVVHIFCQIIHVVLSVLDINGVGQTNKVNDNSLSVITNTTTSIIETPQPELEIETNPGDNIELDEV